MKDSLRQSMALLHTWAGLLFGWLLFAVFATGTAAYFESEITRWMQPEIVGSSDPLTAAEQAVDYLGQTAPDADSWIITLPNSRSATTQLFWSPSEEEGKTYSSAILAPDGKEVSARETSGGYFLYRFHFDLHYMPVIWARYLVGLAAMFMLVAILSGVITHKKIFADFFTLRFGKGQRSWLDAHNVTAVLALPFHLMITFTGLVTLATMYMPWGIAANYTAPQTFFESLFSSAPEVPRTGEKTPLAPVDAMMRQAAAHWDGAMPGSVTITNPGDSSASVTLKSSSEDAIGVRGEVLRFDGASGQLVQPAQAKGPALETESVMIGLHAGRFADWGLRWLYFISGLGGTIMVGSGLVMWTAKRRTRLPDPQRPHFGFRLVERLNIAAIAGLGAGIATYFLANRLLPLGMEQRADWEINSMFLAWSAIGLWGAIRPVRRAWVETLGITAALFLAIVPVDALTTSRGLLASLMAGDWAYVGFDIVMLLLAAGFGFAARKASGAKRSTSARKTYRTPERTPA
ncbi:PepSY domain-containing protein [Aurantiacibacter xanthus]|uniref:PepSY domain-containing protein n=1 Tax=Aurantiacibacter xanthus TaxID=1784712 RepID=A0A3A1P3T4_9SPHN|nr:PepSY-associated TM helix domain-containing protein [Aurantiacibacter xanthus]RIV80921.1 PepSY domain-containing protein [Aurantiacibacter xanthus]